MIFITQGIDSEALSASYRAGITRKYRQCGNRFSQAELYLRPE